MKAQLPILHRMYMFRVPLIIKPCWLTKNDFFDCFTINFGVQDTNQYYIFPGMQATISAAVGPEEPRIIYPSLARDMKIKIC